MYTGNIHVWMEFSLLGLNSRQSILNPVNCVFSRTTPRKKAKSSTIVSLHHRCDTSDWRTRVVWITYLLVAGGLFGNCWIARWDPQAQWIANGSKLHSRWWTWIVEFCGKYIGQCWIAGMKERYANFDNCSCYFWFVIRKCSLWALIPSTLPGNWKSFLWRSVYGI